MKEKNIDKFLEGFVGGVIMNLTSVKQAKIADGAGAVSVMALYKVPADIPCLIYPEKEATRSIAEAVEYWINSSKLVEVSRDLGEGMKEIATESLGKEDMIQYRGK